MQGLCVAQPPLPQAALVHFHDNVVVLVVDAEIIHLANARLAPELVQDQHLKHIVQIRGASRRRTGPQEVCGGLR